MPTLAAKSASAMYAFVATQALARWHSQKQHALCFCRPLSSPASSLTVSTARGTLALSPGRHSNATSAGHGSRYQAPASARHLQALASLKEVGHSGKLPVQTSSPHGAAAACRESSLLASARPQGPASKLASAAMPYLPNGGGAAAAAASTNQPAERVSSTFTAGVAPLPAAWTGRHGSSSSSSSRRSAGQLLGDAPQLVPPGSPAAGGYAAAPPSGALLLKPVVACPLPCAQPAATCSHTAPCSAQPGSAASARVSSPRLDMLDMQLQKLQSSFTTLFAPGSGSGASAAAVAAEGPTDSYASTWEQQQTYQAAAAQPAGAVRMPAGAVHMPAGAVHQPVGAYHQPTPAAAAAGGCVGAGSRPLLQPSPSLSELAKADSMQDMMVWQAPMLGQATHGVQMLEPSDYGSSMAADDDPATAYASAAAIAAELAADGAMDLPDQRHQQHHPHHQQQQQASIKLPGTAATASAAAVSVSGTGTAGEGAGAHLGCWSPDPPLPSMDELGSAPTFYAAPLVSSCTSAATAPAACQPQPRSDMPPQPRGAAPPCWKPNPDSWKPGRLVLARAEEEQAQLGTSGGMSLFVDCADVRAGAMAGGHVLASARAHTHELQCSNESLVKALEQERQASERLHAQVRP